jgi:hypothetical protein
MYHSLPSLFDNSKFRAAIQEQNQCLLWSLNFDLGVVRPGSMFASLRQHLLSSWTVVANASVCSVDCCSPFMVVRYCSRICIDDRSAMLSAEYSLPCMNVAMQSSSFDCRTSGHPITKMAKPVRLFTLTGSLGSSYPHPPAKSAST